MSVSRGILDPGRGEPCAFSHNLGGLERCGSGDKFGALLEASSGSSPRPSGWEAHKVPALTDFLAHFRP